ncbi:MAG: bepG [Acidobacteria bacterium]|nr:bepG [Acidobacteriota bacterium]
MVTFFIDRPIVAMVIAIMTVIVGLLSIGGLPRAQFPDIVPPQIIVTTTYPGADAMTMEQAVASPIEQQMNGVDNMLYMQSTNANDNTTQLTITFDADTDVNTDQVNVQNRLAEAQANLPPEVNQFGSTIRQSTGLPLLAVALFSPKHSHDALFLANYARIGMVDSLLRVPGVGQVVIFGAADYAMRIWVKPDLLAKLGLTVTDLSNAIRQQSAVNPAGQLGASPAPSTQETTLTVRTQGRLETADEFGRIVVRSTSDGSVVRLQDVARLELGGANYRQIGRYNGQPGCILAIFQTPGSNAVAVADAIKRVMASEKAVLPDDVEYAYAFDTSIPVTEGIREIVKTLAEAIVLVMLVVFLFLQSWRATLIPMLAVPVSLIGTFAAFPLLGFSINTLSLFGLVLAVGLVVDDAIVVVEAVQHHIELGLSPRDATIQAMREVSGPVVSIALILAAVFVPVGLMGGIQGRLNKQFAVTIAVAMLVSAFNALTLTPALSAMLLRPSDGGSGAVRRLYAWFNRGVNAATSGYVRVSHALVRKSVVGIAALLLFGLADYVLLKKLPTGFVPEEDYGYFFLNVQLPPAASLARTDEICRRIEQMLAQNRSIEGTTTIAGFSLISRVAADNTAFYFISLKPWDERRDAAQSARSLVDRLNGRLMTEIPDAFAFAFLPPAIPGLGNSGGFSFWLQDRGGRSVEFLDRNVQTFMEAARKRPELAGVGTIFSASDPQVYANVDRDKALKQGVPVGEIYQTLQAYLGGLYVNQFNRFGRQWRVFLQADSEARMRAEDVGRFYVRNGDRVMVPLSALVTLSKVYGPTYTTRFNLYRAVQLLGGAAPGYSSGQALNALEEVARATLPPDMGYDFADLSYQERKASGGLATTFGLSLAFVFLILAGLYESWSLPFAVLLSVPIALSGAFFGLFLRRYDLDVFAQIGLVLLIGLAAKNAILIVEFSRDRLEAGSTLVEAALEGARVRLRPILMTSFAFILGTVPLWTATGSGGASRRVLGTVVITGMLAATAIAIFVIPMLFVLMQRLAIRLGTRPRVVSAPAPSEGSA